jgi:large subunit ribosomal protein L29
MKVTEQLKELRAKSVAELKDRKIDLLKQQFTLRMQKGTGQLSQNHVFVNIRAEIARINTIITEKNKTEA